MRAGYLFLTLILSMTAWAGTPEQDPNVERVRRAFENASLPTERELQLGDDWSCRSYIAIKDTFTPQDEQDLGATFKFKLFGKQVVNVREEIANEFSYAVKGLGGLTDDGSVIYLRLSKDYELIAEIQSIVGDPTAQDSPLVPSIVDQAKGVKAYLLCVTDQSED